MITLIVPSTEKIQGSQDQIFREEKINSVSHVSGPKNLTDLPVTLTVNLALGRLLTSRFPQTDPSFQHKAAVYVANDRGSDGMPRKERYYVCCNAMMQGVMCYRLKDVPPPPCEFHVTDWIPEQSLREWTE